MSLGRVRSVEERLVDPSWHPGERIGYWLTLATLGCFTWVWFGAHALRQFHTASRERDESWAAMWGLVALVSWWFGAGLAFGTAREAGISVIVWAVRLGSLFHVQASHAARRRARAVAEVAREQSMVVDALGHPGLAPGVPGASRSDGGVAGTVPAPGGRFGAPDADPFTAGTSAAGERDAGPARGTPSVVRGRSWGRQSKGEPDARRGRQLESPVPDPWAAGVPTDDGSGTTMWVPGLEPEDAPRRGTDGRGDPAAPPSGRRLDL